MTLKNSDERSLIVYLETRLVDHYGRVDMRKLYKTDAAIADDWRANGYIGFGRIRASDCTEDGSMWVTFTEEAFDAAHAERKELARRGQENRNYQTTDEKRAQSV